jgi:hypothetical protein
MLVLKSLNEKLIFDKALPNKKTARCPEQIICHGESGNRYLIVFAKTDCQKFYAMRSIEYMEYFSKIQQAGYKINAPVYTECLDDGFYAVYNYFDDAKEIRGENPQKWLLEKYKKAELVQINESTINKIEENFLSSWPEKFREDIRSLKEFVEFHDELSKYKEMYIDFQHGDYTPNNILSTNDGEYLMDFEFSQLFQPIGFDLYDYHYATDKKYTDIPYFKLNEIKERLQNRANRLLDNYYIPVLISETDGADIVTFWSDNLVYNKPRIFEQQNVYKLLIRYGESVYQIEYVLRGIKAELCVWLRDIPASVLNFAAEIIFKREKVLKIVINYSTVNIGDALDIDNNWVVFLPEKADDLFLRLSKKSRYNFKREMRLLEEQSGNLVIESYESLEIPEVFFKTYFDWKKESHGTEYGLTGSEYVEKYHITHSMALYAGENLVAILFYCKEQDCVYLENISYDTNFSKCSPGIILYENFLEKMTQEGLKVVFLGNGDQPYKTRFGSIEYCTYSGALYRNKEIKFLNTLKRKIKR